MLKFAHKKTTATRFTVTLEGDVQTYALNFLNDVANMKTYNAIIQHANGKREAVSVAASDYTKAFLFITYKNPITTISLTLTEV